MRVVLTHEGDHQHPHRLLDRKTFGNPCWLRNISGIQPAGSVLRMPCRLMHS
jgi:hypothetical protein